MKQVDQKELIAEINRLKKVKDAVIVAHTYQIGEVQEIADVVGDSFALSKYCAKQNHQTIVFCGVDFMAESAKILSPDKTVLLPERQAGCPMANMITAEALRKKKAELPDAAVVTYINSSAAVKAESDVIVTSSNALKVVRNMPERKLIFTPDQNLGSFVAAQCPEKEVLLWHGYCPVHHGVSKEEALRSKEAFPEALLLVHPECSPEVVALADFVGSTKEILEFAHHSSHKEFIVGTERGVLHPLERDNPGKIFHLLTPGLVCQDMKLTSLESIYNCLQKGYYEMNLPEDVMVRAKKALDRMLELAD